MNQKREEKTRIINDRDLHKPKGREKDSDRERRREEEEDEGRVGASEEKGNTNYEGRVCFCDSNGPIAFAGRFSLAAAFSFALCALIRFVRCNRAVQSF